MLGEVAQALSGRGDALYIHGHLWARPMKVEGQEIYFGHPKDKTFLRLDPTAPLRPWQQLFEASSGRKVTVRR